MKRQLIDTLMKVLGKSGILEWLFERTIEEESNLVLLMYHDVTSKHLQAHLRFLLKHFNFWSIEYFLKRIEAQDFPPKPTALLTFDDGLKSFYTVAFPVVKKLGIPCICYVPTGIIDSEMWLHRRKSCVILPKVIDQWPVLSPSGPIPMNRIEARESGFQIQKGMSSEDLTLLNSHPMVTLGAHSISHQPLPELTNQRCCNEIEGSKVALENIIGAEIRHFAYPKGLFGRREMELVKKTGFESAVGIQDRWVSPNVNRKAIPRKGTGPCGDSIEWLQYRLVT